MIPRDLILCAHATAVDRLRQGGALYSPVPTSREVLAVLRQDRPETTRAEVLDACAALVPPLPLADL